MAFKRVTATFSRPADATAYAAGDAIANSGTAGLVVPITFAAAGFGAGMITGCRAVVAPASGNLVITALDFDLLLFRPEPGIPFAAAAYAGDNAALAISAAAFRELVAVFRFSASAWRNPAGALTAGVAGYQSVTLNSTRPYAPVSMADVASPSVLGIVQALGAWTPGAVINQFDFALDIDLS